MHKRIHIFPLLIYSVMCLFSPAVYAGSLHFIAYGDTRRDIKTTEKPQIKHHAIARVIQDLSPDFILFSGDMVFRNEFDKFREVITRNYSGNKKIPLYPAIGNHEVAFNEKTDILTNELLKKIEAVNESGEQSSHRTSLLHEIKIVREKLYKEIDSIPETELRKRSRQVLCEEICNTLDTAYISYLKELLWKTANGRSWYSFVKEADGLKIKFIALNSSLPDDEEQFQWFLEELKQFGGPKIVFEHYPPYSLGHHGCADMLNSSSASARFRDRYTKIFNDTSYAIVLVISGHDHNYQRICKTDKTGSLQIPVYIVSGGGGADLTGKGECDISQIPLDGFHCWGLVTAYHFVDITVDADDNKKVMLKGKVLGLRYDLTRGLPDDNTFEKQFTRDRLEVIDDFTLSWRE